MKIGILKLELFLDNNSSLKEKRRILKSLKDKIRSRFNVSICEIGHQDKWQMAALAIVRVGNCSRKTHSNLSNILELLQRNREVEVINSEIEII